MKDTSYISTYISLSLKCFDYVDNGWVYLCWQLANSIMVVLTSISSP